MKNKDLVKTVSITLASISLSNCLFIWRQLSGFERGYFYGVFQNPPQTGFAAHGPNFFQTISIWYFIMTVGFCVYITGSFLRPLIISGIVCLFYLSVVTYPFWNMFSYKYEIIAMESKFSYDYWLNNSIYFDCFCLFAAVILTFIQFTSIITRKPNAETFKIN